MTGACENNARLRPPGHYVFRLGDSHHSHHEGESVLRKTQGLSYLSARRCIATNSPVRVDKPRARKQKAVKLMRLLRLHFTWSILSANGQLFFSRMMSLRKVLPLTKVSLKEISKDFLPNQHRTHLCFSITRPFNDRRRARFISQVRRLDTL